MLANLKRQATVKEAVLALILFGALSFMVWSLFVSPKKNQLAELNKQIEKVEKDSIGVKKHIAELKQKVEKQKLESQLQETQVVRDNNDWVSKIFNSQQFTGLPDFLSMITKPGFGVGIDIDSLKYEPRNKQGGYSAVKFSMEASGQFSRIIDYINKIEDLNAPVSIDVLNVKSAEDSLTVSITVEGTYFQLEDHNG